MTYSRKSRKFEDLDFNLVRDLLRLFWKGRYSCFSMEELVLELKKLGYGRDKVKFTIKVLVDYSLVYKSKTKVYRSVEKDKLVRGRVMIYKWSIIHEDFIEKFLSLCASEKKQKGGRDNTK